MSKVILILINHDLGLYQFRRELLMELIDSGYEVHIGLPDGDKVEALTQLGCVFHDVHLERRKESFISDLSLLRRYFELVWTIKPAVVLTYTIKPNIYGGIVCRILNRPYMANITGLGSALQSHSKIRTLLHFLYRRGLKKAKTVFFQNASNAAYFKEHDLIQETQAVILPGSGVNCSYFEFVGTPNREGHKKYCFIGRLMREKGIYELLEAIEVLKNKGHVIELDLYGFVEEDDILQTIEAKQLTSVHFKGMTHTPKETMSEYDVIVVPSYHEGMSNVVLEAASLGKVVLASDIPGCHEGIIDEVSGLLFEVKSGDALAEALEKVNALDFDALNQMGMAAREHILRHFDRRIIVGTYKERIQQITSRG